MAGARAIAAAEAHLQAGRAAVGDASLDELEACGQGYLAVNWEATVDELAALIQPHPSMSELFGETVIALTGRSLH